MYNLQKKIFLENYKNLEEISGLDFNSVLDVLFCKKILELNEYEAYFRQKPRQSMFQDIKSKLLGAEKGYEIFQMICQQHGCFDDFTDYKINTDYDDAILRGKIISLPNHYVPRTNLKWMQKLNKLKTALKNMVSDRNKVIVHGMIGYGKSVLAASSVRDRQFMLEEFGNNVHWIKVGKITGDDTDKILNLMYTLYDKILINTTGEMIRMLTEMPQSLDIMQNNLLALLRIESYRKTLLILDDVYDAKVIRYFDVGCKMLITSREKIQWQGGSVQYILVDDGFTLSESLEIFKKSLNIEEIDEDVYNELYGIYIDCMGDPISIKHWAERVGNKKDAFLANPRAYLDNLYTMNPKDSWNKHRFAELKSWYQTLDPQTGVKFLDLAIFLRESNIPAGVFSKLWSSDNVLDILEDLEAKNFITSKYARRCGTYIYGVHHVYLDFLRTQQTDHNIQNTHKKLIAAYKNSAGGDFARMVNDNYIYHFFGHHLSHGKMFEEFKVYLNLYFLEAKIKATGPTLVLEDIDTYKELIFDYQDQSIHLQDLQCLVMMYGQTLHDHKQTSIIQYALMMQKDSWVYKEASRLAADNRLYFDTETFHKTNYFSYDFKLNDSFRVACFAGHPSEILVGTTKGNIELWKLTHKDKQLTFKGHSAEIVILVLNSQKNKVLSVCADGYLKIWNLSTSRNSGNFEPNGNSFVNSPRRVQDGYQMFFGDELTINHCYLQLDPVDKDRIITAAFAKNASELYVVGTENGVLKIPHLNLEWKFDEAVKSAVFVMDDVHVAVSVADCIYLVNVQTKVMDWTLSNANDEIRRLYPFATTNRAGLISVHDSYYKQLTWKATLMPDNTYNIADLQQEQEFLRSPVKCSTMVNNMLIMNSIENRINIFNLSSNQQFVETLNYRRMGVVCLDATISSVEMVVLLSGFEDQMLTLWHVNPKKSSVKGVDNNRRKSDVHKNEIFATRWNPQMDIALVALATKDNCLQIISEHNLLTQISVDHVITKITFHRSDDVVYYALETGSVFMFDIKQNKKRKLFKMNGTVEYLDFQMSYLLCATDIGYFKIYNTIDGKINELLDPQRNMVVIQAFLMDQQVVAVMKRQTTVCCWNLSNMKMRSIFSHGDYNNSDTTTACSNYCENDRTTMICVLSNTFFYVLEVVRIGLFPKASIFKTHNQKDQLRCCQFSKDGNHLAIGSQTGKTYVWNLKENSLITLVLQPNASPIESLQFSQSCNLILVSVSDQIAWWDLSNSRTNSIVSRSDQLIGDTTNNEEFQWEKIGTVDGTPHLLSLIKLQSHRSVKHFSASRNFTKFLAIDNTGEIYKFSPRK
ncbi:PREDICTED: apoptotic protease-activating factor 1-like isoform X2 [Nicrophorus vespilloides]|uniref:Apoptotic protease-activating factor 1-like isoform X2 n=1 Tax=Nicrophorus vespilloides TaxID=110193 RepID=A0ABM1M631_NICVS|nr:PREDICTED: apoptotic protease-activating factor 1-like isoform X2 [Nicrophorus vespilloides]